MVKWDVEFPKYENKTITYENITMNIPDSQMFNLKYDLLRVGDLLNKNNIKLNSVDTGFISFLIYKEVVGDINKQMPSNNIIISALEFLYQLRDNPMLSREGVLEIENNDGSGEPLFYIVGLFGSDNTLILR